MEGPNTGDGGGPDGRSNPARRLLDGDKIIDAADAVGIAVISGAA